MRAYYDSLLVTGHSLHDPRTFTQKRFVIGQVGIFPFNHKFSASRITLEVSSSKVAITCKSSGSTSISIEATLPRARVPFFKAKLFAITHLWTARILNKEKSARSLGKFRMFLQAFFFLISFNKFFNCSIPPKMTKAIRHITMPKFANVNGFRKCQIPITS